MTRFCFGSERRVIFARADFDLPGWDECPDPFSNSPVLYEDELPVDQAATLRKIVRKDGDRVLSGYQDSDSHPLHLDFTQTAALQRTTRLGMAASFVGANLGERRRLAAQASGLFSRSLVRTRYLPEQEVSSHQICERLLLTGRGSVCLGKCTGQLINASLNFAQVEKHTVPVVTISVAWPPEATGVIAGGYLLAQLANLDAFELTIDGVTETISPQQVQLGGKLETVQVQHALRPNQLRPKRRGYPGELESVSVFTLPLVGESGLAARLRALVIGRFSYAAELQPPTTPPIPETFNAANFRTLVAEHLSGELLSIWRISDYPEKTPGLSMEFALEIVRIAQVLRVLLDMLRQGIDRLDRQEIRRCLGENDERNTTALAELREYIDDPIALRHLFLSFLSGYARSGQTMIHVARVADLALSSARDLGLSDFMVALAGMEALFHDPGKTQAAEFQKHMVKAGLAPEDPDNSAGENFVHRTFNVPTNAISDEEYLLLGKHTELGAKFLNQTGLPWLIIKMAPDHHIDYGEDPEAGLLADVVKKDDAMAAMLLREADMMSGRSKPRPLSEALLDAILCSGTQFNPVVVQSSLDAYGECLTRRPHAEFFLGTRKSKAFFNQPGGVPMLLENLMAAMEQVWPDQRLPDDLRDQLYLDLRQALIPLVKNQAATGGNLKLQFKKTVQGMEAQIFILPYQLARGEQATAEHAASLGFTSDQFEIRQHKGVAELWTKTRTLHFAPQQAQQVLRQA